LAHLCCIVVNNYKYAHDFFFNFDVTTATVKIGQATDFNNQVYVEGMKNGASVSTMSIKLVGKFINISILVCATQMKLQYMNKDAAQFIILH
jgi:hypothetical protein